MRWKTYFDRLKAELEGKQAVPVDFYALEEAWTLQTNPYPATPQGSTVDVAKEVYRVVFE